MRTRQELLDFLAGLEGDQISVAVAVAELLRAAGPDGAADRGSWLAALRGAYRSPELGPSGNGADEAEAMGGYVEEQILGRLDSCGLAHREPEGEAWERLRVEPELWAAIVPHRDVFLDEVERTVEGFRRDVDADEAATPGFAPSGRKSHLSAVGLTKIYRKRRVVNEVEISVDQGEIVGLLGPNGAGKTTTFYMIVGLIPPNAGEVYLDGREITKVPMYKRARMGIGYLAQEPSVFRRLTVEQNVSAILETLDLPKAEKKQRLNELLDELSIDHLRDSMAYSLSGGERRRLEITRALVQRPKFMLLDEPFAGIDPIATSDIQHIVRELKNREIGVIISDHNVEQTLDIVDRAYIMYEGRIRVGGSVSELVWNDEVAEIYLGPTLTQRMRQRYARPVATV